MHQVKIMPTGSVEVIPRSRRYIEDLNSFYRDVNQPHLGLVDKMVYSQELKEATYKPVPIGKLRRIYDTATQGLTKYMPAIFKNNQFFTVKELEMFIELGHSASDFHELI